MGYTAGRGWIEHLRSDYAHHFLGLRLNDWTAIVCFLAALAYFLVSSRRRPGKETAEQLYWPHFKPYAAAGRRARRGGAASAPDGSARGARIGRAAEPDRRRPAADDHPDAETPVAAESGPAGSSAPERQG